MGASQVGTVGMRSTDTNLIKSSHQAVISVDLRNTNDALLAAAEQRVRCISRDARAGRGRDDRNTGLVTPAGDF